MTEQTITPAQPEQIPLALIAGQPLVEMPQDLYIPPAALRVFLQAFEGPLDLLLYLIRKNNVDILDIPIAEITRQYIEYVELMKDLELELAADYLVMAAMLAEIKSRLLLPRTSEDDPDNESDPRAELVRRLQEYERFKTAAENLDQIPRRDRDIFTACAQPPELEAGQIEPDVALDELLLALQDVLQRAALYEHHHVLHEPLSVRERMSTILQRLQQQQFVEFVQLFTLEEGRRGVVVSFIAILELLKQSLIEIVQTQNFTPIHLKASIS